MNERFEEFCHTRGNPLAVDRVAGVLKGVKLLGLTSRNGRRYRPEALGRAVSLYEGAKVNINHAKGGPTAPRDYQDRFGRIRGAEYRPGEGLFGDLHFNPKHPLSEQLLWDAEHAPEQVGFSHNVLARTSLDGGQTVVDEITRVDSVDLVADPATTRGLFEEMKVDLVNEVLLAEATLEQLSTARPDLVCELREAADLERQQLARRIRIAELLSQYDLPMPGTRDPAQQRLTSETFLESLMESASDEILEARVADRARLVETLRTTTRQQVTVREQLPLGGQEHSSPTGAKDFATCLKG